MIVIIINAATQQEFVQGVFMLLEEVHVGVMIPRNIAAINAANW
jgi:hypothetical protein